MMWLRALVPSRSQNLSFLGSRLKSALPLEGAGSQPVMVFALKTSQILKDPSPTTPLLPVSWMPAIALLCPVAS